MRLLGFTEQRYVDVSNSICNMISKFLKDWIEREVKYWSWQYHYSEINTIIRRQTYSFSDNNPMVVIRDIINRANSVLDN